MLAISIMGLRVRRCLKSWLWYKEQYQQIKGYVVDDPEVSLLGPQSIGLGFEPCNIQLLVISTYCSHLIDPSPLSKGFHNEN